MKKTIIILASSLALVASSCGLGTMGTTTGSTSGNTSAGGILGSILGGLANENTLGSLTNLVIGSVKLSQSDLIGTWTYVQPACAFTSENLLAKAGGAVAAGKVNEQLLPAYKNVGISSSNTTLTFDENGNCSGKIDGVPISGTYTFNSSTSAVKIKSLFYSTTAYATRTTNGLSFTFESKKLLSVLQTVSKLSGNSTLSTVGDLSKNYDGVRVGFDMKKR